MRTRCQELVGKSGKGELYRRPVLRTPWDLEVYVLQVVEGGMRPTLHDSRRQAIDLEAGRVGLGRGHGTTVRKFRQ
jgi:hypothetical protein